MSLFANTTQMLSTPRKPVAFGSEQCAMSPSPHLHFICDTSGPILKSKVLSTLLHFYLQVDPQLTWSWEFTPGPSKSPKVYDFGVESLAVFNSELNSSSRGGKSDHMLKQLAQLIRHALVKVDWTSGTAPFQSPIKRADFRHLTQPKIRNYMFIMSPLPSTLHELRQWAGAPKGDLRSVLALTLNEMMIEDLWSDAASKRVCVSWINSDEVMDVYFRVRTASLSIHCQKIRNQLRTTSSIITFRFDAAQKKQWY
jgi:hypothetical protein